MYITASFAVSHPIVTNLQVSQVLSTSDPGLGIPDEASLGLVPIELICCGILSCT